MKFLFTAYLAISMAWLAGCETTGVVIPENQMSLNELKRAIVSVLGEPRGVSPNGYEIKSKYYDKNDKEFFDQKEAEKVKARYYSDVEIVGDRRPYDINVKVIVEIRSPEGAFEKDGEDELKAQKLAEKIRVALHESRDKRNVIDDFQAF